MILELDRVTRMMLAQWSEHRENEPKEADEADEEYAVHVEYLRIRRDRWEQADNAWRLLIGTRLACQAIEFWETGDNK